MVCPGAAFYLLSRVVSILILACRAGMFQRKNADSISRCRRRYFTDAAKQTMMRIVDVSSANDAIFDGS